MFPELAARQRPRQPGTTLAHQERKQRNDEKKRTLYTAIRRDADDGMSGRAIERKYTIGWRTVQAALASATPPTRTRYPNRERASLQGLIPHIDAILEVTPTAPVREIWERLLDQHHAITSYSSIRT